eukprot:Gb_37296 [translate_table: standard]
MDKSSITVLCIYACAWVFISANGFSVIYEDANAPPKPVDGLSWSFYKESCPKLESIVEKRINVYLKQDITQAAGLLRLHFHDCFVQGCDASVLLDGSTSGPGEQDAPPNLTLREKAFKIIDDIKNAVEAACSGVVSCADILALAARDSVKKAGGPKYRVPLGRRDGLNFANLSTTLANLPPPSSNVTGLMSVLGPKGFSLTNLVALSGGHTIGIGHCTSFDNRLYNTSTGTRQRNPTLDQSFAKKLYSVCPAVNNAVNSTHLDVRSPNVFDNKYYVDLLNKQTLFTSDQSLYTDARTRDIVKSFALDQTVFFKNFVLGMLKMGQLNVLTGSQGEIRSNCSVRNPSSSYYYDGEEVIEPIVRAEESSWQSM